MSKIPKILQVSGVLYNHTEYPVGSIERAKALFAEMWHSSQLTETVISSWDDAKRRILEERAWEKLGREKPEDVFREIFGEKYELVELGKVHISKDATIQEAEAKGRSRLAAEMVRAEGITQVEAAERVGISQPAVSQAIVQGKAAQAAEAVKAEGITQTEAAERFGVSQAAVSKAVENISAMEESSSQLIFPPNITERHAQADFRKLSPEGQDRVRQGEPLNRVALAEGVRRRPSTLEQAQKAFRRLTKEDRDAFDSWRGGLEL